MPKKSILRNVASATGLREDQYSSMRDTSNLDNANFFIKIQSIESMSAPALSADNPVSDEVKVLLNEGDRFEKEENEQLYGVFNNTIVTLSSIQEFDGKKDWLA